MLSGAGSKALCAGGDVAALALQNESGPKGQQASADFFQLEYKLDHVVANYSKPFISVMDGITMGGGVGLSVHAPFRIATERTLFAMPETTIGFFPDVGGSFFLPRLDGEVGTYLALTSARLSGVQALYAGVATHYLHSSVLGNLTTRLSELTFNDHDTRNERLRLVNSTMAEFSTGLPSIQEEPIQLAGDVRRAIDRCFGHDTVEEIMLALEQETECKKWAKETLETISSRSPTSLKVTLRQMRLGKEWSISETFQREAHVSAQFMRHPDFVEGVKARLMSKPPRQAAWKPATLAEVNQDQVDAFFNIPKDEQRMELLSEGDYTHYPHLIYGLPTEYAVKEYVQQNPDTRGNIIEHFVKTWKNKEGVKEKVGEVLSRQTVKTDQGVRWRDDSA